MNPNEFIETYNSTQNEFIYFKWNGKHANELVDENIHFRRELIKYIESIDFNNIPGELLRDLIVAESQYAKEAWGIYRYYYLMVEKLLNQTGYQYLDDIVISGSLCFDTYCSTLRANPSELDFDVFITEINKRKEISQNELMLKAYDIGIAMYTGYMSRQSHINDESDIGFRNTKTSILLKLKKNLAKYFKS
ncbi:hypothetical protein [Paenibacillus qinlingensis]|uniref:hypothetical protein n=1 Tax=Paenibacillus qinlingensis TaxID=1837343 RepID=UPI001564A59F|nr:hypothetical protein [Paenibacillus qinlingensis]NQX58413.1 hypothetical protein [Paenibacillus qinlingensis]